MKNHQLLKSIATVGLLSFAFSSANAETVNNGNKAVTLCKSHISGLGMDRFKLKKVKKSGDSFSIKMSAKQNGELQKGICTVNREDASVEYTAR